MKRTLLIITLLLSLLYSNAQGKKIFTDFYNLTDSLAIVKTIVEEFATEMKNEWKNDSLKILGQKKYGEVRGVVEGIISSFSLVIMSPTQLNATIKSKITQQLKNLYTKMNDFSSFYVSAKLFMTNGSKFGPGTITVITTLFEAGVQIYNMIQKFIKAQREKIASDFKGKCSLVEWSKLPAAN